MKNNSVLLGRKVSVDNILEIRLSYLIWNRIKSISAAQNCSYSWVVRYALFRFIKRVSVQSYISKNEFNQVNSKFKSIDELMKLNKIGSDNKHRHKLCLYGKDELFIRLTAAGLECTMTHLVRVAILFYLDDYAKCAASFTLRRKNNEFKRAAWYWLGIKLFADVKFPNMRVEDQKFEFIRYNRSEYW